MEQVNGRYKAGEQIMMKYLAKAKQVIQQFQKFSIEKIFRKENAQANALSRLASVCASQVDKIVHFKLKETSSIAKKEMVLYV